MKTIACLGSGNGKEGDAQYDAMVAVGRLLAQKGCTVITGGFGGAGMEAPAKGAKEADGKSIGYTMLGKPGNPYLSKVVDCQERFFMTREHLRPDEPTLCMPPPEIQYGIRLGNLLTADGFIISAYSGPGTMVELMAIINLNTKMWKEKPKRFAILDVVSECGEAVSALQFSLSEWGLFPKEVETLFSKSTTPQQAVDWVCP